MKSLVGKIGTLALVAMAGVAVAACSSSLDKQTPGDGSAKGGERTGTVGLSLVPVAGITLNNVHFVVSQGTTTISEGDLPTPGTSDNFSFGLPLPVGNGYTLSLSGVSVESANVTCTGSFGPFDVLPNTSTAFTMALTCVNTNNGQVISTVNVETEDCPRLIVDYVVALPSSAALPDGTIAVAASAHDLDSRPITYSWSIANAAVGDFTPATGASTTLNCNAAGDNVEVTVTADNGQCDTALKTTVSCVPVNCGDGVVDPAVGETCDTLGDPTCPADCNRVCGDGVVETGEECDVVPQNLAICSTSCELVDPVCGDGLITPPEVCDGTSFPPGTPMGSTCVNNCGTIQGPAVAECNGTLEPGEECDAGAGVGNALCSGECEAVSTQACVDCENAGDCFEFVENCGAFTGSAKTLCYDVMQCIQDSNCDDGTGTLGFCFCGDVPAANCGSAPLTGAGSPNGACKDLIVQGLQPVTTSAQVLGLLTATGRPAGGAMARLNCQKTANEGACFGTCGFTPGGPAFP